jgi:choline-sulfatase
MPNPRTEYSIKIHRQEYFAIITHMDEQIGKILRHLRNKGLDKNTYIVFTSDHGLSVGHHGLAGKQNMYEHTMKVPFFIAGPGIKSYTKIKTPIYLQDAMATALDLANVDKPTHVEFKSIMPLINENKKVQYPKIYGKYMNFQRMIIEGDYKLIMYPTINKIKLFNLYKDPMETNNLADHPEYHFKAKILKNSLISLQKKMGDNLDLEHPKRQKGDLSMYESH